MASNDTFDFIQHQITRSVHPLYLIFGITGCSLNILLLSRRRFRTVSCSIYFVTASIMMIISLIFGVGPYLLSLININPIGNIRWFCKMRLYLLQTSSMIYRWSLAAACFDRYALSSVSVRLRNLATVQIARRLIAVLICIWLILPIHGPILYDISLGRCNIFNNRIGAFYHSIFTTLFGCILPVVVMIVCAVLLYYNLILKQQRHQAILHRQTENRNETGRLQRKRDRQVFLMLIIQVFVYLICITPLMISNLYNAITLDSYKSNNQIIIEKFTAYVAETIIYFFCASSFYLYTMVSKIFRDELKRFVCSTFICKSHHTQRIVPTTNDMPLGIVT